MTSHSFGGDWTEQKLQVLDDYLTAYCRIFESNPAARHFETVYVDAFAGGGLIQSSTTGSEVNLFEEFSEPDTAGFLEGSASRALRHAFDRYIFIEKSDARIAELERLRDESPLRDRIAIRQGDANAKLKSFASSTDWKKTRAVVFLDPYGMQVDWATIVMLGDTKAVDLWLLFPLGQAVMRLLQKRSEPPPEWQRALDRIFGTHAWYDRFYRTETVQGFFEEFISTHRVADSSAVAAFMIERMESVFFSVAQKPGVPLQLAKRPDLPILLCIGEPEGRAYCAENCQSPIEPTKLNGGQVSHRMDGGDVESGDGLHQDQRRLQELLRGAAGAALAGDGESSLSAGVSRHLA